MAAAAELGNKDAIAATQYLLLKGTAAAPPTPAPPANPPAATYRDVTKFPGSLQAEVNRPLPVNTTWSAAGDADTKALQNFQGNSNCLTYSIPAYQCVSSAQSGYQKVFLRNGLASGQRTSDNAPYGWGSDGNGWGFYVYAPVGASPAKGNNAYLANTGSGWQCGNGGQQDGHMVFIDGSRGNMYSLYECCIYKNGSNSNPGTQEPTGSDGYQRISTSSTAIQCAILRVDKLTGDFGDSSASLPWTDDLGNKFNQIPNRYGWYDGVICQADIDQGKILHYLRYAMDPVNLYCVQPKTSNSSGHGWDVNLPYPTVQLDYYCWGDSGTAYSGGFGASKAIGAGLKLGFPSSVNVASLNGGKLDAIQLMTLNALQQFGALWRDTQGYADHISIYLDPALNNVTSGGINVVNSVGSAMTIACQSGQLRIQRDYWDGKALGSGITTSRKSLGAPAFPSALPAAAFSGDAY